MFGDKITEWFGLPAFPFVDSACLMLRLSMIRPSKKEVKDILALGVSPFIMTSTESLISIVINRGLSMYGGDLYVGSFTIIQSIMQMISAPV